MKISVILLVSLTVVTRLAVTQDVARCDELGTMNMTSQGLTDIPFPDLDSCGSSGPLTLILADNDINTLLTGSFKKYPNLYFLDLSSCKMSSIHPQAFNGAHALRDLDMSCNPLKVLDGQPFEFLLLETLHIRGADLLWIEAEVFADGFQGLRRLDLSYNKLTILHQGIFNYTTNLVSLKLSHNRLRSLDLGLFSKMENIAVIELSYNSLSEIPRDLFDGLAHLRRVELSHNPLAAGPVVLRFSPAPFVALVNCSLTSLPLLTSDSTAAEDETISLDMRDNPIKCDCSYVEGSILHDGDWRITCEDGTIEKTLFCLPVDTGTTTKTSLVTTKDRKSELRPTPADLVRPTDTADDTKFVLVGVITGLLAFIVMLIAVIVFMYVNGKPRYQRTTRVTHISTAGGGG